MSNPAHADPAKIGQGVLYHVDEFRETPAFAVTALATARKMAGEFECEDAPPWCTPLAVEAIIGVSQYAIDNLYRRIVFIIGEDDLDFQDIHVGLCGELAGELRAAAGPNELVEEFIRRLLSDALAKAASERNQEAG